jgi:hypothetical protein
MLSCQIAEARPPCKVFIGVHPVFRMHKPPALLPVPPILKNAEALSSLTCLWLPWGGLDEAQEPPMPSNMLQIASRVVHGCFSRDSGEIPTRVLGLRELSDHS